MAPFEPGRVSAGADKHPLLSSLGMRVKHLRAKRGMPRRVLATTAEVSERHLANLESGIGNVSVLVLHQIANALDCSLAELVEDEFHSSTEWLMIRKILDGRTPDDLNSAHQALTTLFIATPSQNRSDRVAFVGMRGAGKSTLGRLVAERLNRPFFELRAEVARLAGGPPAEIQALYGSTTFRRYERQALEETLRNHRVCVIATAGGLASDPASMNLLLTHCFTIWLQASPEEHLNRVVAQGDMRPTADLKTAIDDLRMVLESRTPFYSRADFAYSTSGQPLEQTLAGIMAKLAEHGVAESF